MMGTVSECEGWFDLLVTHPCIAEDNTGTAADPSLLLVILRLRVLLYPSLTLMRDLSKDASNLFKHIKQR